MREKAVLFSGYHIAVNDSIIQDLQALGYTVYMPDTNWGIISFFAPNHCFTHYSNVKIISHAEFMQLPPMFLLAACVQQAEDFKRLWRERGEKDIYIWLTATQDAIDFPEDYTDFLLTHVIGFHRKSKAKYKILYFNRPSVQAEPDLDFKKKFESKQINFFINELTTHPRHTMILDDLHKLRTTFPQVKFYGYQAEHGNLTRDEAHRIISQSMFTGGIKHWETHGQTINESMLLYTPTLHLNKFNINILKDHEINVDNAILTETVEEMIDKINNMTLEEYVILCYQARASALQRTDHESRREQLDWLLSQGLNN